MKLKVYDYKNCSTCRNAIKWLDAEGIAFTRVPIRETPPSVPELKKVLKAVDGDLRRLFNTAGGDYRAMKLKDTLPDMSDAEALQLLSEHGNLVKRPFVVGDGVGLVGFKEAEWREALG